MSVLKGGNLIITPKISGSISKPAYYIRSLVWLASFKSKSVFCFDVCFCPMTVGQNMTVGVVLGDFVTFLPLKSTFRDYRFEIFIPIHLFFTNVRIVSGRFEIFVWVGSQHTPCWFTSFS